MMATLVNMLSNLFPDEYSESISYGVIVAIIAVIISIIFLIIKSTRKNKRQGILLLGLSEAGKTTIFLQLTCKKFKTTYTSLKPNIGEFALSEKKKKIKVIDLPGYERQREIYFEEHKGSARGIVFALDSATVQKEIKEVAGYLYTILSDRVISSNAPPLLILCNKQDLTFSKGANVIRTQLEKEMTTLRITRSAALKGVGDTANNNAFLGKRDKDFDFTDVKPIKVEFAECSVITPDMQQLHTWLNKVV